MNEIDSFMDKIITESQKCPTCGEPTKFNSCAACEGVASVELKDLRES